jgi:hypothetical protein
MLPDQRYVNSPEFWWQDAVLPSKLQNPACPSYPAYSPTYKRTKT